MDFAQLHPPIHAHFESHLPAYLDQLQQMVAINSFTANAAGVDTLGRLTAQLFAPLGFAPAYIQSTNPTYGHHLVLTRPGKTGVKIGLISHLDTVFPPEEEIRNDFHWREAGNRIYGPGTVDIKGGTVAIYMILDAIHAFAPHIYHDTTWVVLLDASEETSGDDFAALCRTHLAGRAAGCLIFEAGAYRRKTFKIVTSRKGMAIYQVRVNGRAAHAGSAHPQGANAIVQLGHTVTQIAALTDYSRDLTFNVGTAAGGTVTNRVPHAAEARVEMRAFTPEVYDEGVAAMLALSGPGQVQSANGFQCTVQVEKVDQTIPWPPNDGTRQLFAAYEAAATLLGARVRPEARGGLSDGNMLWDHLPTLDGLGPDGGNAHCSERAPDGSKDQEYVLVSSFVPKAMLNTTAVLLLLEQALAQP